MPATGAATSRLSRRAHMRVGWLLLSLAAWPMWSAHGQSPPPPSKADAAARRSAPGALVGHGGPVKAIAVSADGTRALTGSFDYTAMLWDISVEPPRQLLRLSDHNGAVNAVAFAGRDRILTAGDDGMVRLFDGGSGTLLHRFEGHDAGSKIVALDVSSDGALAISAGWDRRARLWDLAGLKAGPVLEGHKGPVNAVVLTADSAFTAGQDGQVGAWSHDGQLRAMIYRHGWGLNVMTRAPSTATAGTTELVVGGLDGSLLVIDGRSGDVVRPLPGATRPVLAISPSTAASETGLLAVGSGDGTIRLVRIGDGTLVEETRYPFGPAWAVALRPVVEGRPVALYHGGLDDFASLWQATPRLPFEPVDASQFPRRFQRSGTADTPIGRGELQFARKCSVCHTLTPDGANRAGPTLHAIFGRRIGTLPGYPYSPGFDRLDIIWTPETLSKLFELGPDKYTPGSKMPLQVMSSAAERADLVAYLAVATRP